MQRYQFFKQTRIENALSLLSLRTYTARFANHGDYIARSCNINVCRTRVHAWINLASPRVSCITDKCCKYGYFKSTFCKRVVNCEIITLACTPSIDPKGSIVPGNSEGVKRIFSMVWSVLHRPVSPSREIILRFVRRKKSVMGPA